MKNVVIYANDADRRQSCALCRDWNLGDCEVCRREVKGMTVKEWMNRARELNIEIDSLLEEQQAAFAMATGVTVAAGGEKVQASKGNTTEMKFTNYAAYSELIDSRIDELYKIKREILMVIKKVDDTVLRALLLKRYILFKTWEKVADEIHYSYKHTVHSLHPKALQKIEKVIECNI